MGLTLEKGLNPMKSESRFASIILAMIVTTAVVGTRAEAFIVQYRPAVTDMVGQPIDRISTNTPFLLHLYVDDLRADAEALGVFGAFATLQFDESLASANGVPMFQSPYGPIGLTTDLRSDFGGVGPVWMLNGEEREVAAIPMISQRKLGTINFQFDKVSDFDQHGTLVYGWNELVPNSEVNFSSVSLTVIPEPTAGGLLIFGCCFVTWRRRQTT